MTRWPARGTAQGPLAAKGLFERGVMRLQVTPWPPRLFFTEAGSGCQASEQSLCGWRRRDSVSPDQDATESAMAKQRMGRNPATGEAIQIAASQKVAFRPAKEVVAK